MEKKFKVNVNKTMDFTIDQKELGDLDVIPLEELRYHVLLNHESYKAKLESSNFNKKEYSIKINSNTYDISISNPLDLLIKEMGFSVGSSRKTNEVKAPMPGIILSVNVKNGQEVTEGETLLILEAMKMENAIVAPKDGIIKAVNVKNGGTVDKGALMVEME